MFTVKQVHIDHRRRDTLESLLNNVVKFTIYIALILIILKIINFNFPTLPLIETQTK